MVVAAGSRSVRSRARGAPRVERVLHRLVQVLTTLTERIDTSTLRTIRWLPHQDAFLRCLAREKLLRVGNQVGKSTAGLAEIILLAMGEHPYRENPPEGEPWEAWIVCSTWFQSVAIQKKFWELVPKEALDERSLRFDEGEGFRGKQKIVRFKNGRIVRFKTTAQGAAGLASATINYVLVDELTTRRIYTELKKRVMALGGTIATTATPVNFPSEYLQKRAEEGQLVDLHFRFEPELFIPVGESKPITFPDGTPKDARWVAAEIEDTPEEERETVCHGEWPSGETEREMRGFSHANLFDPRETVLPTFTLLCLSFDHGEVAGREVVLLGGWTGHELWILGEYCSTGESGLTGDAEGVRALVLRTGLTLADIDLAVGDINSAGQLGRGMAVNEILEGEFATLNGGKMPFRIEPADKTAKDHKIVVVNAALANGKIRIHKNCRRLIEALRKWKGQNNRLKDPIDTLSYLFNRLMAERRPFRVHTRR